MATPTDGFSGDLLKQIMQSIKSIEINQPRQSLLASAGFKRDLVKHAELIKAPTDANPLMAGYTQSFAGIEIVPMTIPPEEVIDWSGCRSPSRAKRRHARGIPQRIKVEHRERAYLIDREAIASSMAMRFERMALSALRWDV
jgi:hypothetical protein